ncbi:MipA/OmpV family protein [Shewanella spartinae]|uniref:MipA/OmpV family protein n=1 Tax=Shewanella spartinae TaxID=2864205 RepID=UPI001C65EC7F|nr:MipA/OmpV family protein [Shewanella spartinae]QYJ92609.1 MipA/OmpV family protein [Shewanella spartinae]
MNYLPLALVALGSINLAQAAESDTYISNGQVYHSRGWVVEFGAGYNSDIIKEQKNDYKFAFGDHNRFGPRVNVGYHGDRFNADLDKGINYRLYGKDRDAITFSTYLTGNGLWLDKDVSKVLAGMEERRISADLGLNMDIKVGPRGVLSTNFQHDISGEYKGYVAGVRYQQILNLGRLDLVPFVAVSYNSAKFNDHYFGVSKKEALPKRAQYEAKAGVNYDVGYQLILPLSSNWRITQQTSYTRLSKEIADSPITDSRNQWSANLMASYRF